VDKIEPLGKYLKRERELRNISLREVAKNTRVREHVLRAIEEDQYEFLPSATYVKGFLLAYAKYIGLDPHEVILRYESVLKGKPVTPPEVPSEKKILWDTKYLWLIVGIIVVSLIISYSLFLHPSKPPIEPIAVKPKAEETLPSSPSPQIAETTYGPEEKPFSLQLKAVEETWVRIQVNGQPEQEMTLKAGETTSHRALKRIHLIVGNAGGLDLIFKGRSLEKFGKSGEVITLIFTPQGVETKRSEKQKPP
jgi:transcriptional regulator with XRE-family HTH domain